MILKDNNIKSEYDAFGHVKLDKLNPGVFLSDLIADKIGAQKVLVQKSGYFARSSSANKDDLKLISESCKIAIDAISNGHSGVVGMDSVNDGKIGLINFNRIKGGKSFDIEIDWFQSLLKDIKQI